MIFSAKRRAGLALLTLFLLGACASTPKIGGDPNLRVLEMSTLPEPTRTDLAANDRPYYIGPLDKLVIDVFGMPELANREVQVDASGRISFPIAGSVDVRGKTPAEVEEALVRQLRSNFVRDPKVSVNLKEATSQLVTVEGEVKKPGLYPVVGRMTLMGAVAQAQGTSEFSNLKDVVIFRTVQGQRLAALYDLKAIRHGNYADPAIYPNDIVMVGDDHARRVFKDILSVVPLLTTPIIVAADRF